MTNFYDKFISHIHIVFLLSLYYIDFCFNTYIYILVVPQIASKNGCSNNIPLKICIIRSSPFNTWYML